MPKKPVTSIAELARMLLQAEANATEVLTRQILDRFGQQTFVGGKRVAVQKLPWLPKKAATTVHRVKVSLHSAKPPVWRRIEIPSFTPLDLVHEVIQVAFDWHGYHLHVFETVCGEFGSPDDDDDLSDRKDETPPPWPRWPRRSERRSSTSTISVTTGGTTSWWRRSCLPRRGLPTRAALAGGGRRAAGGAAGGLRRELGLQRLPNGPGCHVCSEAIWSASQRAGGVAAAVAASAAVRRWRSASGMASAWCRAAAVSLTS